MALGVTASVIGIAGGINSLTGGGITNALGFGGGSVGGGSNTTGQQAQQAADPFAPYRANLGAMYSGALQPGTQTDITKMPGYSQFNSGVMQPALDASKSSAAASGMLYSSGEQQALQKTAQQGYYGFMTDYLNRLAQGSGAVNNPAQAAGMGINQGNANQAGVMQGLGGIATGVSGLASQFSGGGGGGGQAASYIGSPGTNGTNSYTQSGTGAVFDWAAV